MTPKEPKKGESWRKGYQQGSMEAFHSLYEEIEKVKEAVQEAHGTHKYDSCYDDCLSIIKRHIDL